MLRFSENRRSSGLSVTTNPRTAMSTHGLVEASQIEALAGTARNRYMSPFRTAQYVAGTDPLTSAAKISFSPSGTISSTTVQDAIEEVAGEVGATDVDVFLIGGQSNAVGQGTSGPAVPSGKVLQYYSAAISNANDPVGNANTGSAWPAFGLAYHYGTGRLLCFVPSAVSGSAQVAANDVGSGNWDTTGALVATSFTNVTNALAALIAAGYIPTFKGVLWSQGETDAAVATNYQTALTAMIARYRTQYGATIPFYIFRTGTINAGDTAGYVTVRTAQEAVAAADPHTHIVFHEAYGFVARGLTDGVVHYSQAGLNEMGRVGAANVIARFSLGGSVRISETGSVLFGGNPAMSRATAHHVLNDFSGNNAILLGGSGDPTNYYRNTAHKFQSIAGTTSFVNIDTSGIGIRSTGAAFDLIIARPSTVFTANRTLTLAFGDANRTINMNGDIVLANSFATSGNFALTLTQTGSTNVTLPTTGTLAALGGTNSWSGVNTFGNTTDASSTSTGAIICSGGVGIAKELYVGGKLHLPATTGAIQAGSATIIGLTGDYTAITDPSGGINNVLLGNTTDPTNYFRNTNHNFQNRSSVDLATLTAAAFTLLTDRQLKFTGQTSSAAAQLGTLTNAPAAGNPAFWLRVTVNTTSYAIPCWAG